MRIRIKPSCSISKSVDRAANPGRATVKDMGIDHRRLHVAVAQKLLDRSDIVTPFQQMGSKGMAEGVSRFDPPHPPPSPAGGEGVFSLKRST